MKASDFWPLGAACAWAIALLGSRALQADTAGGAAYTPARVSLLEGEVSYYRPSYGDWQDASLNLPLATGDVIATRARSRAEIQLGAKSFLRLGANTELRLDEQSEDVLRFYLSAGRVGFDLRDARAARRVKISSSSVTAELQGGGFYRFEVDEGRTRLITRRGGRMWVAARDQTRVLAPDLQLVVDADTLELATIAPPLDEWDRWNLKRTERLLRARRAPVWSDDLYGLAELDAYGEWRLVPTYGYVWIPRVPRSWAPYSAGRWVWDPFYGWTWVDLAPWGWAPFHYGRWVFLSSVWAWAPGPVLVRPVYAPALVVFFSGSGFRVGFGVGTPVVSWVPLGWGEPCYPWWGPPAFRGKPWWGGWHGPRRQGSWEDVPHGRPEGHRLVNSFEHARFRRAVLGVPRERFGRRDAGNVDRLQDVQLERLLVREDIPRRPRIVVDPASTQGAADPQVRRGPKPERRIPDVGRFRGGSNRSGEEGRTAGHGLSEGQGSTGREGSGGQAGKPERERGQGVPPRTSLHNVERTSPRSRAAFGGNDRYDQVWGPYAPRFRSRDSTPPVERDAVPGQQLRYPLPRRPETSGPPRDPLVSPPPLRPPNGERVPLPGPLDRPAEWPQGSEPRDRGMMRDVRRPADGRLRRVEGFGAGPRQGVGQREAGSPLAPADAVLRDRIGRGPDDRDGSSQPRRESPRAPRRPVHR